MILLVNSAMCAEVGNACAGDGMERGGEAAHLVMGLVFKTSELARERRLVGSIPMLRRSECVERAIVMGGMLAPVLLVLSQSVSPSPLLEVSRAPLEEPAAVTSLRTVFEANVLSVEPSMGGTTLRRGARAWRLEEDEWPAAFELLPELHREALSVSEKLRSALVLVRVGLAVEAIGLAGAMSTLLLVTFSAIALPTAVLLAILSGLVGVTGAVLGIVPLAAVSNANARVYELVGSYNRQLAHVELPATTPVLSVPLP